jgi:PAS domain S-box-containing protein
LPGGSSASLPIADRSTYLDAIIDSAMDAIITIDSSQKVVMFNRTAERIFGVPAASAIGSRLERFIPERFHKNHSRHVEAFGKTGVTERAMGRLGTIFGLRADGQEFPIEASISYAVRGGISYYTVILRDISEKVRLEAQLLQAQKMESIGRLAGGVAHDFNNLLMAMFNYLALANRRLEPDHPARPHIAHTQEIAERAAGLTRQLLAFARKQTLRPHLMNPREVVAGVEPILRRMIGEDILLTSSLADDTAPVIADASQLEQVLMNLAVNARDAMPAGGSLNIATSNVSLDQEYCNGRMGSLPGEHVLISVTDSGEGMSPEIRARIFEPFFTTKAPGKGTGLGLATCHGIISQHGGHIAVHSEVNKGTTVDVYLPRAVPRGHTEPQATPTLPPVRGGSETVLLAEDSRVVCDIASSALREAGYTVLAAESGVRALELATHYSAAIHLLITDVVMPEMGGRQLADALAPSRPQMRVIFISGYAEDTIEQHGVSAESTCFVPKPFMNDVLLRKVREVLDAPLA